MLRIFVPFDQLTDVFLSHTVRCFFVAVLTHMLQSCADVNFSLKQIEGFGIACEPMLDDLLRAQMR